MRTEAQQLIFNCAYLEDGSKSDSDNDRGPVFSTYSSSSVFDKLSPAKKGTYLLCPPEGALTQLSR